MTTKKKTTKKKATKTTARKPVAKKKSATKRKPVLASPLIGETVLLLRTCGAGGRAHDGFRWPLKVGALVKPERWDPRPICGFGLHGLLWGEGDVGLLDHSDNAVWMVIEVEKAQLVDLGQKVKAPQALVRFVGKRDDAVAFMQAAPGCAGHYPCFGTATAGDSGTATAGVRGTATAGVRGTATAGDSGTATAGHHGAATAGHHGAATAGYGGTATAGYGGTATAGDSGTATAGDSGTATAGVRGTIIIAYYDYEQSRYRRLIGEVGIDGIEANVPYVIRDGRLAKK